MSSINDTQTVEDRFFFDHDAAKTWPARSYGPTWNGFVTPRVDRATLVAVLADVVTDDETSYLAYAVHEDGSAALVDIEGSVDHLKADPTSGLYDLGALGWTLWATAS